MTHNLNWGIDREELPKWLSGKELSSQKKKINNSPHNAGDIRDTRWEDPFEKEMVEMEFQSTWEIAWTEEPSWQSLGSQKSWTPSEWLNNNSQRKYRLSIVMGSAIHALHNWSSS